MMTQTNISLEWSLKRCLTNTLIAGISVSSLILPGTANSCYCCPFVLSGTMNCLFACSDTGNTAPIEGNFTLDDLTGTITTWSIASPTAMYQSGQSSTASNLGFALSFLISEPNQSTWLTLFDNFKDPDFQAGNFWVNENTEFVSGNDYTYGSYWEGKVAVSRGSSTAVPEPSLIGGMLVFVLGQGFLKRKKLKTSCSR